MNLLTIGHVTLPVVENVEYRFVDERRMEHKDGVEVRIVVSIHVPELEWIKSGRSAKTIEPQLRKVFRT